MTVFNCILDLVRQGYSVTIEQPYSDAQILSLELYKDGFKNKQFFPFVGSVIPKDELIVRTLNRALYEHQYHMQFEKENCDD